MLVEAGMQGSSRSCSRRASGAARRAAIMTLAWLALLPCAAGAATDFQSAREKLESERPMLRAALKGFIRAPGTATFQDGKRGAAFGKYVEQALRVLNDKASYPEIYEAAAARRTTAPATEAQRQALGVLLGDYMQVRYGADILRELKQLVAFKTFHNIVDRNSENPEIHKCFDSLMALARGLGLEAQNHGYETLEITLPSADTKSAPLALYTHADVVRVLDWKWQSPPFELQQRKDRWYGLGVYDDKGPLLANLFALRVLRDAEVPLARPIVLLVAATSEQPGAEVAQNVAQMTSRPALVLAADGEFPYATGENGRLLARISSSRGMKSRAGIKPGQCYIKRMIADLSPNTVPATARVWVMYEPPANSLNASLDIVTKWRSIVEGYQKEHPNSQYETVVQDDTLHFFTYTMPAHTDLASQVENSLWDIAGPLGRMDLFKSSASDILLWIDKAIQRETTGKGLGIAFQHPQMGSTSVSPVGFERIAEEIAVLVDIRWPLGHDAAWVREHVATSIAAFNKKHGMSLKLEWLPGAYEPAQSQPPEAVQTALASAFKLASGQSAAPAPATHASGRILPAAIPFGPEWPDVEKHGHSRDESISERELQDMGFAYVSALAWLASAPLPATP